MTEVREMIFRSSIRERLVSTSSCTPSAKYSFSFSALRLVNGSTAIDLRGWAACGAPVGVTAANGAEFAAGIAVRLGRREYHHAPPARSNAAAASTSHARRPRARGEPVAAPTNEVGTG